MSKQYVPDWALELEAAGLELNEKCMSVSKQTLASSSRSFFPTSRSRKEACAALWMLPRLRSSMTRATNCFGMCRAWGNTSALNNHTMLAGSLDQLTHSIGSTAA